MIINIDSKKIYKVGDLDLDTWEPIWRQQGWSSSKIRSTRPKIHHLNKKMFDDMGISYGSK